MSFRARWIAQASSSFTLDFYASAACDASGHGEGATFLGTAPATTDANGHADFMVALPVLVPAGQKVTATAIDSVGNTSEFSVCYEISAPGSVQFTSASYSVAEQNSTATIFVTRTLGSASSASVDYATSNGTATEGSDYSSSFGTLNFAAGETTKSFPVTIFNDLLDKTTETINFTMSNPSGGIVLGSRTTSVLNIFDNDNQPSISINDITVAEGDTGSRAAIRP